ncbi:GL13730 [Drosophila persimilis]|uniref:Kunitz-type serine protease inhibitor PPTI-like n=2 Tax=pseudoobscura subgroup TaxID=32358 RepID=A0A6I8V249_DROPS|nr:kunitz-type serine protease inhibitor [Drosophila persimilis]XP_002137069.1 kunitz-type serine protease inhibitor PPTI [Drosophila pseudoobscura]EDW38817.1 GL13730 [Drosophila persimilis]
MVKLMLNFAILSLLLCLASATKKELLEHRKKICMQPSDYGSCKERRLRWYYDPTANACKPFTYSGCGGTYNRFERETECWNYCMDPDIFYETS